jgi:hypothetical protein
LSELVLQFTKNGNGLFGYRLCAQQQFMGLCNIALANGAPAPGTIPVGSYVYDDSWFSYFARLQYDYVKENTCCQVCFVAMHQQFGPK